nr:glycosyltransferase family 4 protein [uncultured Halomonas sp.]
MTKKTAIAAPQKRKPRLLWANLFCLLDTSSGASMSVRQMLLQLVKSGYEVEVLGATVFDDTKGMGTLKAQFPQLENHLHQLIEAEDSALLHQLVVTYSTKRNHVTAHEEDLWYLQYCYLLDNFKPDIVWLYGGQTHDFLIADEARVRGIPTAFYLANGNYKAARWCRDIDLILTDSQATADMYRERIGFVPQPVGKFIDPDVFVADHHERQRLLFVNPNWAKGASAVVQLALKLEQERPDITLEVVEARADWSAVLQEATQLLGEPRDRLSNVVVTGNTSDMRPVYERARVLLAPSLWWESGARVLAEAMLNGIPAIVSNHGGSAGLIEDGGIVLDFPNACHEPPYKHLLSDEELQPLYDAVISFYDDESLYQSYVERAKKVGAQKHHIEKTTERLLTALSPLAKQRAGNKDFTFNQKKRHRHNLAENIIRRPELQLDTSFLQMVQENRIPAQVKKLSPRQQPADDFDWRITSKVIVLDNRAKLIHSGALNTLLTTKAFSVIAFDPASEVKTPEQYEGKEDVQLFPHALLGDGYPATLYACLNPNLTSTLAPLPSEQLSQHNRQGAQVIAKLPINTITLDSIEGLASLDWLILDDLSDASNILEHGETALKNTLLIQARVTFQPTHERQPDIAQLSHWASRNGFRFYRLNDTNHQSLFPEDTDASKRFASELTSADALFLPSEERLKAMHDSDKQKLVFLLHTVFNASDMAYRIMQSVNDISAKKYLKFVEGVKEKDNRKTPKIENENNTSETAKRKLTKDELVVKFLPESSMETLGSIRWLIEKEKQFGGLQRGVVRNKTSKLDPRKPHQFSAGFVQKGDEFLPTHIGGDRMSMNYHGYSIAYSTYLLPLIET